MEYRITDQAFPLPEAIDNAIKAGFTDLAHELIRHQLKQQDIPDMLRRRLAMEEDLLERRRKQYPYSFEEAESLLENEFDGYKPGMLKDLILQGRLDWAFVDGKIHLEKKLIANAHKRCSSILEENPATDSSDLDKRDFCVDKLAKDGHMAARITVKETLRITDPGYLGKRVMANLPMVRPVPGVISSIQLISASENLVDVDAEDVPMRTLRFFVTITDDARFEAKFSYLIEADRNSCPEQIFIAEDLGKYLCEEMPHIRFTPYLKELARQIVSKSSNSWQKAEAIYSWITTNVEYSFMRSYSTIDDISTYAAANRKGDCGIQAMLFVTLCRINGIPARWQSGWYVTDECVSCHDWAEFNVSGKWFPVDCSFGGGAYRLGAEKRWKHYFASLDTLRMIANESCCKTLSGKKAIADDPVDNQRGEAETENGEMIPREAMETILETVSYDFL